jgi:DNA-binding CsgD family transcriptional regulator
MEILLCSVSGLTNPEIAARLGISIRTVDHHHLHIYNKLGINNRIELYTMALRYRLLSN